MLLAPVAGWLPGVKLHVAVENSCLLLPLLGLFCGVLGDCVLFWFSFLRGGWGEGLFSGWGCWVLGFFFLVTKEKRLFPCSFYLTRDHSVVPLKRMA